MDQKNIILIMLKAAKEGCIVVFDELNAKYKEIKESLNKLLVGESPDGNADFKVHEGFRLVGSINGSFNEG
ncbi:MAG: hypothetical protein ACJAW3_001015 [Lentimonas sp.]|jgi:hypothetical protein